MGYPVHRYIVSIPVRQRMWAAVYNYSQALCEKNAVSEGVGPQCVFQHGDANKLDFPDGSFDAMVSNYVYHNITGADKQELLMETLRVLRKGGVFALNDDMKPGMYGDMEAFAQKLRDMMRYVLLTLRKRHLAHTAGRA